jgi:hypothetical protein
MLHFQQDSTSSHFRHRTPQVPDISSCSTDCIVSLYHKCWRHPMHEPRCTDARSVALNAHASKSVATSIRLKYLLADARASRRAAPGLELAKIELIELHSRGEPTSRGRGHAHGGESVSAPVSETTRAAAERAGAEVESHRTGARPPGAYGRTA